VIFCANTGVPIQEIEFDIAVSVSEGNSTADAPEITVGSSTFSGNAQTNETTNSSTNRAVAGAECNTVIELKQAHHAA